jgi:hypothetical protein
MGELGGGGAMHLFLPYCSLTVHKEPTLSKGGNIPHTNTKKNWNEFINGI